MAVSEMILDQQLEKDLDLLLTLKVREFRKYNIKTIDKEQIREYLFAIKWKTRKKIEVCELAQDVFSLTSAQIFEYMSRKAIIDAATLKIDDFMDLITK